MGRQKNLLKSCCTEDKQKILKPTTAQHRTAVWQKAYQILYMVSTAMYLDQKAIVDQLMPKGQFICIKWVGLLLTKTNCSQHRDARDKNLVV